MNKMFPDWDDANTILNELVKAPLDVIVEVDEDDRNCVDVRFIKDHNFDEYIPDKYKDMIFNIINKFYEDTVIAPIMTPIFKKYSYETITAETLSRIRFDALEATKICENEEIRKQLLVKLGIELDTDGG